ncbi:MAG: hypothetical protein N2246_08855, partial [Candidatus Sumerlaeia bacterium]|nr:hypothetical protein [Candidatus Sumerlaeia bacterium]
GLPGYNVFYLIGGCFIENFTIKGGNIAIYCVADSNPTIANCKITETYFSGVYLYKSSANLINNEVYSNKIEIRRDQYIYNYG